MSLLQGKTGLVFGVANDRSYAWHIAKALTDNGATCAFTSLPGEKNERRTGKAVESLGLSDFWLRPCDAAKDEDLDAVFDAYTKDHKRLDFVIHSIAFADREWLAPGKFTETPRAAYLAAIDISAYTLLAMAQRARGPMADSGGGSILAMTYYGSEKVVPGYNVMGVAKAALECTMRYLAAELGEGNIRVNTISGGPLRTLASSAVGGIGTMLEHTPERAPLRRNIEGSEVGGAAAWLVSDLSSGVTGENIYVDCGVNTIGV
ncbi:MAG: enoyl-ACP reductase [Phycisphaeraceae bacterium]|nr:MAG: enoyl-ACP reductase [Phycisphaeraceae bacterium]